MNIAAYTALWFLPFVAPIAFYIAWTDLSRMKIPNHAVITLFVVYAIIGPIALPLSTYLWGFLAVIIVLVLGILFNAAGVLGAGDAKYLAAAAPLFSFPDMIIVVQIFCAALLGAWTTHRLVKYSLLRKLANNWESWNTGSKFPMGFTISATLVIYLALALRFGAELP
ncbi:prepilin peptidase [Pseudaestuariivita rosea]|uniref:prepilin peptidase n=1 Tax=Pseudaestuariivita rosea TaxID=2763263 RepID=UPI001ABA6DAD|nr:prepilin peptidase [Pseudaestuariivita rosea]